jgi:hypothetical protein
VLQPPHRIAEALGKISHRVREGLAQPIELLEAQGKGSQTHEHLLAEFDRLRESLADAMGDLSERLRNAMRGL